MLVVPLSGPELEIAMYRAEGQFILERDLGDDKLDFSDPTNS